ncbi:MAG TPA: C25 family cysteine peptidase [Vicinamibacterales bacterium]|nr:C25 family cysteine peptidase [Vicinamibacterales bacterium]
MCVLAAVAGIAAFATPAFAQSTTVVGSFTKTTGAAPTSQTVSHNLGQTPVAILFWTEGRTDQTFSNASGVVFRAAASAGAASGNVTINVPAGTQANDVMLAAIGINANTPTVTAPGGWTLVRQTNNTNNTANALAIYRRVATTAEPASYTWTISANTGVSGGIMSFSGVDLQNPIDVENGQANGNGTNQAAPAVTTTGTNEMIVTFHTIASSVTWTPPAGMTEAIDVASQALGAAGQSLEGNYLALAAIGTTGTRTAAANANADRGNGETVTLRPAYASYFAMGMTDGVDSGSVATSSRTGVATSVEARRAAAKALTIMKADTTVLAEADFQAWDATTFTLNWTTNDTMPYIVHYVAIGGTGVQAKVVNWQMATVTGPQLITGFGFQPNGVLHIHANSGLTGALPATGAAGGMGMGAIDASGNQWATSTFSAEGNPSDAQRGQQTNVNIFTFSNALGVTKNAAFTGWNPDGFNLNYTVANANAGQVFSLGLKGVNVKAGSFNKATGAAPATQSITGLGFQPQAVFLHSFQDVAQANPVTNARLGWGASDGSVDGSGNPVGHSSSYAEQDAASPSNFFGIDKTNKAFVKVNNTTATIDAEADVTSVDPDGFTLKWTTNDAVATQMLYFAFAPSAPTEVRLRSFDATRYDRGTLLEWRTGYEFDNLGFNLYREVDGVRTKVNTALVAGSGLLAGKGTAVNAEQAYARWDLDPASASASAVYWLEDLDFSGKSTMHGPFVPVAGGVNVPTGVAVSSDLRDLGRQSGRKKVFISHNGEPKAWQRGAPARPQAALATQQAIAGRPAVKIGVRVAGWYRVGQPQLVAAGLDPNVDPRSLQLFVDGVEQAIRVTGEADGRFDAGDAVEFYGTGTDTPFTDTRVYWLVGGGRNARRIESRPAAGPQRSAGTSFWSTIRRKDRSIYFAALVNGDAENWFGPLVSSDPTSLTIASDHLDPSATAAELEVTLQGVTSDPTVNPDHRVGVLVNGVDVGEMTYDGQANATQVFTVPASALVDGDNDVTLQARGGDADLSLVDVLRLTYRHTYTADADMLVGTVDGAGSLTLRGFASPAIRVVDITVPDSPVEWAGATGSDGHGLSSMTVRVPAGAGPSQFLAFSDLTVRTPAFVTRNTPSTWHAAQQGFDYVLVSERTFLDQARTLAALRAKQGHKATVVDVDSVYDEFNFGEKSPQALRDFLQAARANWRTPPKFVVLMGDATTDPRDYAGMGSADFVPTKQVAMTSVALETASDDWFADFNDDGLPEIAMGRLSVRTPEQAAAVVAKIAAYDESATAPWTKNVLLVADENDDTSNFERFADRLNALVPPTYATSRINRGPLGPAAHQTLIDQVNSGQLIVDYSGHGSVQIWGKEGDLLTNDDVASWTNASRLPFVVAMNCLNGLFTQVWDEESLAEALQRAPQGGAVAIWASSSVTSSSTQSLVNEELFRLIFQGTYAHLGEAVAAAKAVVASPDLRKSWIFFGDPAMRLASTPLPGSVPTQAAAPPSSRNANSSSNGDADTSGALARLSKRGDPIRLQDFSGDRRADIVTYDAATGQWTSESVVAGQSVVRRGNWGAGWQAVAADLDGDGRSDVVLYRRETSQWMQGLNIGGGAFAFTSGTFPGGPAASAQLLVGDFNGDRRDDVIAYDPVLAAWTLALSDGRGGFVTRRGTLPAGLRVQVADLNGDGIADLFGYDATSGNGVVALSSGDGRFATTVADFGAGWRVTIGRFGGRAGADLLFYNPATGAWRLALNDGRSLAAPRSGAWAPGFEVHAADLDADGRDDLFAYNPQTGDWFTAASGSSGRWTMASGAWTPGWSVAVGDLNGDGRDDIALLDPSTGVLFHCITVGPGAMAFESRSWTAVGALVGRPR